MTAPWRSLHGRLWMLALGALALALVVAGAGLNRLFDRYLLRQFDARLQDHMVQLLAALQPGPDAGLQLARALADPRWERPYSGLYWQIEAADAPHDDPVLRSVSLWDERLYVPADVVPDGGWHQHTITGPAQQALRVLERTVRLGDGAPRWRVLVAADMGELAVAQRDFRAALVLALGALAALLALAVGVQLRLGLQPLRTLQQALQTVRAGHTARLQGDFPTEVQPLVADFNRVLAHDEQVVERARRLAGNLAHAIKTPLAVMSALTEDDSLPRAQLTAQLREQIGLMRQQVDWQLRRARAASTGAAARHTPVAAVLEGLVRLMNKVYAQRVDDGALTLRLLLPASPLAFAGEAHDLHEMVGNLLDNACKWARSVVELRAEEEGEHLRIWVEDDGPGLTPAQCETVLARGVRADERQPGAGLGLDIVREVAALYGGRLRLQHSPLGGLQAELELPRAGD